MCTEKIAVEKLSVDLMIPSEVTVSKEENHIQVSGKLGTLKRDLSKIPIKVEIIQDSIKISSYRQEEEGLRNHQYCKEYIKQYDPWGRKRIHLSIKNRFCSFPHFCEGERV